MVQVGIRGLGLGQMDGKEESWRSRARHSLDCSASRPLSGQLLAVLPTMRSSTPVQSANLPSVSTVWMILPP